MPTTASSFLVILALLPGGLLACGGGVGSGRANPGAGGGSFVDAAGNAGMPRVVEQSGVTPSNDAWPTPCPNSDCGTARALAVGANYGCYVDDEGLVHCWRGDPTSPDATVPQVVSGLANVVDLVGGDISALAVLGNGSHALIDLSPMRSSITVIERPELQDLHGFAVGTTHVCGIDAKGGVVCSGSNSWRELGIDDKEFKGATQVPGVTDVVELGTDVWATCALRRDGTIICWGGAATFDDLGVSMAGPPTQHRLLSGMATMTIGADRACGLDTQGRAWCWGNPIVNRGGGAENWAPRLEPWLDGATRIDLADDASCGLLGQQIRCEIHNGLSNCKPLDAGRLCDVNDPVVVDHIGGLVGVERIALGGTTRCALMLDKTVWCWAANRGAARPINLR